MSKQKKTRKLGSVPRPLRPNSRHVDNYPHRERLDSPTTCPECGLVLIDGRWRRAAGPAGGGGVKLCPACRRARERFPAGTLRLPASFAAHRDEVLGLLRNVESAESEDHPLERLMEVADTPEGGMLVTTTGVHLARQLAHKLEHRFHLPAHFRFSDGDQTVHVVWSDE